MHQMDIQGKSSKMVNSKLTISTPSGSTTNNIGVTTRSMSNKLNGSSQMTHLTEYVQKDLDSPSHASEDDGNKSPPSSPHFVSSYSFTTNVAPVVVSNVTTIEKQLANNVDTTHIIGKQAEAHDEAEASTKQHYTKKDKSAKEFQVSSDGMIPVDQLKEFIEGTIRSKIDGNSKSPLTHSKLYTQRIDNLKMSIGYQPLKSQQFDGKCSPKQHAAHFIETCNNAGTYDDHLVKQFV
ncbi:hypothetical protein Sango_0798400 [Sesamum angolense]|uniref:Uncharacterized protein n=1 Tax=Sesamum angolense TaxID=2727404 RepID=A0AAE2C096_9LAMI|nr:hypothetical protein Sango_0798400 [Sesamum angolense]